MESVNNTTLPLAIITDASGGLWGISCAATSLGGQVTKNGVIDGSTLNVVLLLYSNHVVYHQNASGNFYKATNPGWTACPDPRIPVAQESASGTTVTSVGPAIVNASLEKWTLVSSATNANQIAINGVVDGVTNHVTVLVYMNQRVYQENSGGGWWYKAKSSDPWTLSSDPRIAPPVPTPPTPTPPAPTPPTPVPTPTPPTPVPTPTPPTSTITHYGTTPPHNAPVGWTTTFFDDFTSFTPSTTGPFAATDATKNWALGIDQWTFHLNGGSEQEYYCSPGHNGINPFSQSGSVLTITARAPTSAEASKLGGYQYISGALSSKSFLSNLTGGYFEMYAQLPPGTGMWSAFWLSATNTWPPEMDIMEQVGSKQNQIFCTAHYGTNGSGRQGVPGSVPANITTGFHRYGGLLTPNYLAYYFDGVLLGYTTGGLGAGANNFNSSNPMFMIMNLGLGTGMNDGPVTNAVLPASMAIDWVRASALGPQ